MPVLDNPFDTTAAAAIRADQSDPLVMYLIVDKSLRLSQAQAMSAAAQACVKCAAAHSDSPQHAELFRLWHERSYRKVALRADTETYSRLLLTLDHGVSHGVFALPPIYRSAAAPEIQALRPVTDLKRPKPVGELVPEPHPWTMQLITRTDKAMTDGKAMAQAGHAAMMCNESAWRRDPRYTAAFEGWWNADLPMDVQAVASTEFEVLKQTVDSVVVRDAGLTQVDPGTETVLAFVPGITLLR